MVCSRVCPANGLAPWCWWVGGLFVAQNIPEPVPFTERARGFRQRSAIPFGGITVDAARARQPRPCKSGCRSVQGSRGAQHQSGYSSKVRPQIPSAPQAQSTCLLSKCGVEKHRWFRSSCLRPFTADAASQLDVLRHDGDALCVDGAQVGVYNRRKVAEQN